MFSFNSGQRLPKLSEVYQFWSFEPKGKLVIEFLSSLEKITPSLDDTKIEDIQIPTCGPVENINPDHAPEDRFMDGDNEHLLDFDMTQVSDLNARRESKGLPPDFVRNLCLNRIFTEPWETADLKLALTGLDYLSNLEGTRRMALRDAAHRLHINEYNWREVLDGNYHARSWVCSIEQQEEKIEQFYSTLYVDLRIWIMIKELRSEPFYKPNVIAMLNTLFPPVVKDLPNARISKTVLHKYRNTFYRYIVVIEAKGSSGLDGFVNELARPASPHSWKNTRNNLKEYVTLADLMINQAAAVHGISFFNNREKDNPFRDAHRISCTTSDFSDRRSMNSNMHASIGEYSRPSLKSEASDKAGSRNSSSTGSKIPEDYNFVFPKRSKISGQPIRPKPSTQDVADLPIQSSPPSPWDPTRYRSTSVSGRGSIEVPPKANRFHAGSFSRPTTPSIEQQKLQRRIPSAVKRPSGDYRKSLPDTPELPSPQENRKPEKVKAPAAPQLPLKSDRGDFLKEPYQPERPAPKSKKSPFNVFRRKKKVADVSASKSSEDLIQEVESYRAGPYIPRKSMDKYRETLTPQKPIIHKKPSFSFLQGRKSSHDYHEISESNSEHTIIERSTQHRWMLKPKASLSSLFVDNDAGARDIDLKKKHELRYDVYTGNSFGQHPALRKARSASSVKSTSSTKPMETQAKSSRKYSTSSGTSYARAENMVITSADISEPFPFGNFVRPQLPAILIEDSNRFNELEKQRMILLEKSKKERRAKWEQSDDFRREPEVSRENRAETHAEKSRESYSSKQKSTESKKAKHVEAKKKDKTPESQVKKGKEGKGTPKTPLSQRLIKELAKSYSPT